MKLEKPQSYQAYLIRLWQEDDHTWRATLENPHTGERQAFADVEMLLTFIRNQVKDHN